MAAYRLASTSSTLDTAVAPPASDLITTVDGVMGGRPVIRGTRITAAAVKGRVSGGDSLDDLVDEYPGVPREAFEAALAHGDRAADAHLPGRRRDV